MQTNPLLYGLIGFFLGGLLVSVAATTFDKPEAAIGIHSMSSLQEKTGDNFDKAFMSAMIEHHEGAINMANLAGQNAKNQEIKDLSEEIVAAQQKEIKQMKQWQADWGYVESSNSGSKHSDDSH